MKSFIQWQLRYQVLWDWSLTEVSFLANLLTICIACLVSPHLMYHMFNLYKGLPFPSPALDQQWRGRLGRGPCPGGGRRPRARDSEPESGQPESP